MNKKLKTIMPLGLIVISCVAVMLIGYLYLGYISDRINNDSIGHLREIYGQVNHSFSMFTQRNWGLLESWNETISKTDNSNGEIKELIKKEKERWSITGFYFLSENKTYREIDGTEDTINLGDDWDILMKRREPIMAGLDSSKNGEVTVFAIPTSGGVFDGFSYNALAVSYTNDSITSTLNVDAFSGNAKCFVIRRNGRVLISTQAGGSVFANYLTYIQNASDMDASEISRIKNDWNSGNEGLARCTINGEEYCILYQPLTYSNYILVSSVPQSTVSASFMQAQRATMTALIIIFLAVSAVGIILFVMRSREQRKKSETELAYRDRMFDVLSNNVDDIFLMIDPDTYNVNYVSPNVNRLLGISDQEVKNDIRSITRCAVDFDVVIPQEKMREIPLNGCIFQECEFLHQTTGERRWYRMTVYRMDISGTEKYINILSDRTQEKKMTETLQDALLAAKSANEAKSNFLSNVSHDIRTPMNAIVGFSTLLEKDYVNPDKVREYTHKIMASSHHLLSLINEVLDMSKIESGKTSLNADLFSLPELLEELSIIMIPQAKAKNQDFAIHVSGSAPEHLIGDKLRLNQILINLLSNAVKYTPEGGKIDFSVRALPESTAQIAKLEFFVKDNGIGMSREFQSRIFNPFSREINSVTNKVQGTGLGMAITKNLIDLMGGVINVESEPGKGSAFTVELSFTLPEEDSADKWYLQYVKRILVADDEEDVCFTIREMMKDSGVEVCCVTNGYDAVRASCEANNAGNPFDVILLDWKMSEIDGVETARRIRYEIGTKVPILVLTSFDWEDIEMEARQAGIHAFMAKPFFASTFWQTIKPFFVNSESERNNSVPKVSSVLDGKRFLIVEDNELNAEILTEMLGLEGAECDLAVNGLKAVEMFEKSQPDYYDMIFMDVQMPVLNGYDATRRIRSGNHPNAKTVPIVAMTANTFSEDVRDAFDAGMNGHLGKPIDMDAVRETVAKLLGK